MAKRKKPKGPKLAVQVDIVSDVVCPWCWLGYRLFAVAEKQLKTPLELSWRPYMLDPTVPADGMDYKTYMKNKFGDGPSDKFKAMRTMLEEKGQQYGIGFQFDKISKRPNTLNAHRIIRWAQNNADAGSETAEALFKAFFAEGKDIGKAKEWMDKAMSMVEKPRFWQLRQQSLIYAKAGDKKGAIELAKKSLADAEASGNADYIKMNKDSLMEWGAM